MKILTLVCNFLLLGLICFGIITSGTPEETRNIILVILASAVLVMNVIIISGSRILPVRFTADNGTSSTRSPFTRSSFLVTKIIALILNILVIVITYLSIKNQYSSGSGNRNDVISYFIYATYLISALTILASKWNKFEGLKRTAIITGISLAILITVPFITFRTLIGKGIKENISIAKKEYPGKAEDALLAYLADSTKTPRERTEIAVWTLGQIRSRKALPVLKSLYKNNHNYHCNHNTELCQYEVHKAIVSIENNWLGAPEKNVFGSWTRLNK